MNSCDHGDAHPEALLRTNERLRDFVDAASDWFFELDRDLRFVFVSERHREVVGIAPDDIVGKTCIEAYDGRRLDTEGDRWHAHEATMLAHKSWTDFTYTLVRDDGEHLVISNSAKAIFDESGGFLGYRCVERDVTSKAHAEAKLSSILNVVPDAVVTIAESGRIVSFSPAAERLFGYNAAEVIGQNVKMLMPQPYHDAHDGYMAHYRETGERRILGIGRRVAARRKDGSVFPINLAVNEMVIEGSRMFTGVIQDVTELLRAQSLSHRLAQILDRSLNEIYVFDADSLRFVQVNHGARSNLGYSKHEIDDLTPFDILPDISTAEFEALAEPLRSGRNDLVVLETTHRRKDGSTYPVEAHLQLMRDETPHLFVAIVMDISETKRREALLQQSQKMEAIGQLTGGIAHDFNNLLTIILGNNELLASRLDGGTRERKWLDAASGAAQRGAQLTGQLLSFARRQPLEPKVVNLNDLIEGMLDMLQRTLGEPIELSASLAPDLGQSKVDPVQLHNAILNLAINARDAMPDGGKLVIETSNIDIDETAARARLEVEPGHYVRLTVRDSGSGIAAEVRERVFEPFFTTKEPGKGTGLGLSMVHGFAKQSGGHVDIESKVGVGTEIRLYLPDAEEASSHAGVAAADNLSPPPRRATVLVVEDEAGVRETTIARLEHLGYDYREAATAREALDLLASGADIDILLTDMIMPGGMSGAELADAVRLAYPDVKIILSSGYAKDTDAAGRNAPWLRKPYSMGELAETLSQVLE